MSTTKHPRLSARRLSKADAPRAKLSRPLPSALAKRAASAVASKRTRLAAEGRDLVALVHRKRDVISEAFYDIGIALRRLGEREMLLALGVQTFPELCESKLALSATAGAQLVEIVTRMTREEAVAMGQAKATALVALAKATPGTDTPGALFRRRRVRLPNGVEIDTHTTSARHIERVAKELRDAQDAGRPRRGRTTTPAERAFAARLEKSLHAAGLTRATVEAVATKPGQPSDLRIAHVPVDRAGALAKALRGSGEPA